MTENRSCREKELKSKSKCKHQRKDEQEQPYSKLKKMFSARFVFRHLLVIRKYVSIVNRSVLFIEKKLRV